MSLGGAAAPVSRRSPRRASLGTAYAAISARTGEVLTEQDLGPEVGDSLQLAGNVGPDDVLYQGTIGAVLRITSSAR